MQRRGVLRTAGVAITAGLAGCMGYTIETSSNIERRKDRIGELETEVADLESELETKASKIEELESSIEDKQSEIEQLQSSVDDKDDEIASLESEIESEQRQLVSKLYALGDGHRQRALSNWQDASGLYEEGDYPGASNEWGISSGQYIDAASAFSEASSVAQDQGLSDVVEKIESSKSYVQVSATAANHFALASYYYAHENQSQGDSRIDRGNDALSNSQQYTLYNPSEIDSDLGL